MAGLLLEIRDDHVLSQAVNGTKRGLLGKRVNRLASGRIPDGLGGSKYL